MQLNGEWFLAGTTRGGRDDCLPSADPADATYDIDLSKNLPWIRSVAA